MCRQPLQRRVKKKLLAKNLEQCADYGFSGNFPSVTVCVCARRGKGEGGDIGEGGGERSGKRGGGVRVRDLKGRIRGGEG